MDGPAQWSTGTVCIGQSEAVHIPVNGGVAIPTAVDALNVVTWYYDRRHELGTTIDWISMNVQYGSNARINLAVFEEKKRLTLGPEVRGTVVSIGIYGADVTADSEGCGTDKMKVYWAYFFEDSLRDDADGPNSQIEPI
jgi:hypothetical protein